MQLSMYEMFDDFDPNAKFEVGIQMDEGDLRIGRQLTFDDLENMIGQKVILKNLEGQYLPDWQPYTIVEITGFHKDAVSKYYDKSGKIRERIESEVKYVDGHEEPFCTGESWTKGGRYDGALSVNPELAHVFYALNTDGV